jgi:hypothetical protein
MAHPPSLRVSQDELNSLFDVLDIWLKIRDGRLSSEPIPEKRQPAKIVQGDSDYVRHKNILGYQVATSHRIVADDGSIPHWHAKDVHIGDIVIWARSME